MGSKRDMSSTFLFAMPSPASGIARLFDLFGQFDSYNFSPTPEQADAVALYSDWRIVGQDLRDALEKFRADQSPAQGNLFDRAGRQRKTHGPA